MKRAALILLLVLGGQALAHDHDKPFLNEWMKKLRAGGNGEVMGTLCCSGQDATVVAEADWTIKDGHYSVRLDGQWVAVPDDAVVTEPNLDGRVLVWPVKYYNGETHIRCFLPGAGT